jgi:type 1 fimbria pilin
VQKTISRLILAGLALTPLLASAATIDASLIPDGTYTVKVEKVVDSKHIQVSMDNGSETTLSAGRATVDFSKVKSGDQIKLSLGKGQVLVYLDLSSH